MLTLDGYGGPHPQPVFLVCTEDEHEGDDHYDATYGLEFGRLHVLADA